MPRSGDLLFKFWDPPNISGMAEDINLQFCMRIDALISPEWPKIRNSNLARRLIVRDTKAKNKNWVKRGRGLGQVTYFSNFGTLLISLEWLK